MQAYLKNVHRHGVGGLRLGDLWPSMGSVAVGVAARGALVVMERPGARREGESSLGELVGCALVAGVCVLGVGFFERGFLLEFVPRGLMERVPVLRRFKITGDDDVGGKKDR